MLLRIRLLFDFMGNMGFRYLIFRVVYTFMTKTGLLKRKFPIHFDSLSLPTLESWKKNMPPFFFYGKNIEGLERNKSIDLEAGYDEIINGIYTFFNKEKYNLGKDYDWLTNPTTNFKYDINKHWTEIQDLSEKAGDIKYVWEKARFTFLYDIVRYDFHMNKDCSFFVFEQIDSFIDRNPINKGPNYKCSQEISLRILNWTFALYYYKDSENLTEERFHKILNSIYAQLHHVYHNIHFSRISVRNNHAITETLMLYLSELLFPFFPDVKKWSRKGKKWFEQEIAYQIYDDGTFLQFSMNYHRVVIQLLTWGIQLSELNNQKFGDVVYERAKKSLTFLDACTDPISGKLPNYGANDGALFFKLTDDDYRVYTSQLNDLRVLLYKQVTQLKESIYWYGIKKIPQLSKFNTNGISEFKEGGYYIIQENDVKTFLRCAKYKNRPSQSDNLHLDIWVDGENIFRDAGSYKYNTDIQTIMYFRGCEGHNTVGIESHNQMLKGSRFVWYFWVKNAKAKLFSTESDYIFEGKINAFRQLSSNIHHSRVVKKQKGQLIWSVKDKIENKGDRELVIYWHINPNLYDKVRIECFSSLGEKLTPTIEEKWHSAYYGVREKSIRLSFKTINDGFDTKITIND